MQKQDKAEKILIFGRGQIGTMYFNFFTKNGYEANLSSADITQVSEIQKAVSEFSPTVVINTAGKTNLEWCNANRPEAFNVNSLGADNIAGVCEKNDIFYIHLSSGCIFESDSSEDIKSENSKPNPRAFYSWTKVWSEELITARKNLKYLILRPRQPVSSEVSEKNMLIKMLTFSKFVGDDGGWNSGTVLEDFMSITEKLIDMRYTGILHVANDGWTTPYKIGLLLKKHINPDMKFDEISHKELDAMTPVKRVAVVLDISKLKSLGIVPENYEKRLEEIIIKLKENLKGKSAKEVLERTQKTSEERTVVSHDWQKVFAPES